jgi:hypothetical protein
LPGVKLYPQGLQLIPGHGVGVCGGCVGCGWRVGALVGLGVGVGVGFCVGVGVGEGISVAVGLTMTAAWAAVGVGVGDGVDARLRLPTAEPIQEKKRSTAMIVPHPMESFTFFVRDVYHCHMPDCLPGGGKLLYGGRWNCPGVA